MDGFEFSELSDFTKDLLELAENQFPKESRKFLNKQGLKLKKVVVKKAKSIVGKETGNYLESIKKGKVYKFDGDLSVRAYSSAPHAHLIEYGHKQVGHKPNKVVGGFVAGKHIFRQAQSDFSNTFVNDAEKFVGELLEKGLG